MIRVVTLPNGRQVPLRAYVAAWRVVRKNPAESFKGFGHFSMTGAEIRRELLAGMHDRINRHAAGHGLGRKWDGDWQRAAEQTARAVNTPRLIVRWIPTDLRARLAHRLTTEG